MSGSAKASGDLPLQSRRPRDVARRVCPSDRGATSRVGDETRVLDEDSLSAAAPKPRHLQSSPGARLGGQSVRPPLAIRRVSPRKR